jgi:hypothetical protein
MTRATADVNVTLPFRAFNSPFNASRASLSSSKYGDACGIAAKLADILPPMYLRAELSFSQDETLFLSSP